MSKVLPAKHRFILIELKVFIILDSFNNLINLGKAQFFNFVALEEAFDINKVIPSYMRRVLIGGKLVIEELITDNVIVA